jgi:Zn finger protein HypA/HybF involved in hydrogenase expression
MPGGRQVRPRGRPYTFACRDCRITLHDGVDYTWCPRCGKEVDWIDGRYRVLTCQPCDLLVNKRVVEHDRCPNCTEPLTSISGPLRPDEQPKAAPRPLWVMTRRVGLAIVLVQAVLAFLDPEAFPYLGPLLVFAQLAGFLIIAAMVVGSAELRAISTYHTTRVIHGLEHATVAVLEERGVHVRAGQTSHGMFALELDHDGTLYENLETTVRDATTDAISRIRFGEHTLAYHRQCGTSMLVGIALLGLAIVGVGIAALILGAPSGLTFAFSVMAAFAVRAIHHPIGFAAQRWLTVSTNFASAVVTHVEKRVSSDGHTLTAIVMIDVVPKPRARSSEVDAVAPIPM